MNHQQRTHGQAGCVVLRWKPGQPVEVAGYCHVDANARKLAADHSAHGWAVFVVEGRYFAPSREGE